MKPKKDIFDVFRQSDEQLTERPPTRAWDRLEGRLERHRRRHHHSNRRLLGMVAGVLFLLGMIALLSVLTDQQINQQVANINQDFQLEELSTSEDGKEARTVMEFSHQHKDRLSIPVAEGSAQKKLVAKKATSVTHRKDILPSDSTGSKR